MPYFFAVAVPAGTPEADPATQILTLTAGKITHVDIVIPAGHTGLAHLILLYHEVQVFPASRSQDYHGDDVTLSFDIDRKLESSPYEFKTVAWNDDETFDHEFQVNFVIEPVAAEYPVLDRSTLDQFAARVQEELT